MCFAIIPKDSKDEVEEVPIEVVDMLGEFYDNVHDGLPTVRKINHQMDLILEASFLDKVVYRMTLIESE